MTLSRVSQAPGAEEGTGREHKRGRVGPGASGEQPAKRKARLPSNPFSTLEAKTWDRLCKRLGPLPPRTDPGLS